MFLVDRGNSTQPDVSGPSANNQKTLLRAGISMRGVVPGGSLRTTETVYTSMGKCEAGYTRGSAPRQVLVIRFWLVLVKFSRGPVSCAIKRTLPLALVKVGVVYDGEVNRLACEVAASLHPATTAGASDHPDFDRSLNLNCRTASILLLKLQTTRKLSRILRESLKVIRSFHKLS